jgi:hypothetical protein
MTTTTKTTTRLPVLLDNVRIATPCTADWDEMTGDARVRFCGKCEKNVYNVSAMTRDEAEALIRDKEGRLCIRMYQRKDGTVITADCPVGVRRARLRHRIWATVSGFAASAALAFGVFAGRARADLAIDGKTPKQPPCPSQPVTQVQGGVAVQPQPPPPVKLMGKIALPPQNVDPKPPKQKERPVMGEAAPLMGDVAVVPPAPPAKNK